MPVDAQIQTLLDLVEAVGPPPLDEGDAAQARHGFRRLTVDLRNPDDTIEVAEVRPLQVDGADGPLDARCYVPADVASTAPTVLFLHGGGFVIGDLDTHDNQARRVAAGTGSVVVSVAYRLAPEMPFPAGVEDAVSALRWTIDAVDDLGGDVDRVGIAGDSAGGNLSAVTALAARDQDLPLRAQLLIYPAVDVVGEWPSRDENAEGYLLTRRDMEWFARQYLGGRDPDEVTAEERADPRLSPLQADLAGVAPAVVATAQYDPLRDEGVAYACALADAGVPVDHFEGPGLIHGYFDLFGLSPAADDEVTRALGAFRSRLGG